MLAAFPIALLGFLAAMVIATVIAIGMEFIAEKLGDTCPVGGSGALMWPMIAIIPVFFGALMGVLFGATGWLAFLIPIYTMVGTYAFFGLLSLLGSLFMRD